MLQTSIKIRQHRVKNIFEKEQSSQNLVPDSDLVEPDLVGLPKQCDFSLDFIPDPILLDR